MPIEDLEPEVVSRRCEGGSVALLLDVRTPAEYAELHAAGAELMPLGTLDAASVRSRARGGPVFLFCRSGSRARLAAERLAKDGLTDCHVVAGGTVAWAAAGLPVIRGRKTMSLERQVRIAAGSLVVVGAILAETVHHAFIALPAFVGAGLVFAGATDWCGMGMLLARLPWNRAHGNGCPASPPDAAKDAVVP